MVELFRACGELAGHKFLRHTACMFVDYATQAGATEVRREESAGGKGGEESVGKNEERARQGQEDGGRGGRRRGACGSRARLWKCGNVGT